MQIEEMGPLEERWAGFWSGSSMWSTCMRVCSRGIWRGIGLQKGNQVSASWPFLSQGWIIATSISDPFLALTLSSADFSAIFGSSENHLHAFSWVSATINMQLLLYSAPCHSYGVQQCKFRQPNQQSKLLPCCGQLGLLSWCINSIMQCT